MLSDVCSSSGPIVEVVCDHNCSYLQTDRGSCQIMADNWTKKNSRPSFLSSYSCLYLSSLEHLVPFWASSPISSSETLPVITSQTYWGKKPNILSFLEIKFWFHEKRNSNVHLYPPRSVCLRLRLTDISRPDVKGEDVKIFIQGFSHHIQVFYGTLSHDDGHFLSSTGTRKSWNKNYVMKLSLT